MYLSRINPPDSHTRLSRPRTLTYAITRHNRLSPVNDQGEHRVALQPSTQLLCTRAVTPPFTFPPRPALHPLFASSDGSFFVALRNPEGVDHYRVLAPCGGTLPLSFVFPSPPLPSPPPRPSALSWLLTLGAFALARTMTWMTKRMMMMNWREP